MDKCIVVTTLSDDIDVIKKISNELINNHLVASSHITSLESSYWWNNEVYNGIEYKLEVRTIIDLYDRVKDIICKLHNYELPEVSYYEIIVSKEIIKWINDNVCGG